MGLHLFWCVESSQHKKNRKVLNEPQSGQRRIFGVNLEGGWNTSTLAYATFWVIPRPSRLAPLSKLSSVFHLVAGGSVVPLGTSWFLEELHGCAEVTGFPSSGTNNGPLTLRLNRWALWWMLPSKFRWKITRVKKSFKKQHFLWKQFTIARDILQKPLF